MHSFPYLIGVVFVEVEDGEEAGAFVLKGATTGASEVGSTNIIVLCNWVSEIYLNITVTIIALHSTLSRLVPATLFSSSSSAQPLPNC